MNYPEAEPSRYQNNVSWSECTFIYSLPVVHYNLTKKVVQLSKKDVYLFEYQTYKYNEQLSSKLQ